MRMRGVLLGGSTHYEDERSTHFGLLFAIDFIVEGNVFNH